MIYALISRCNEMGNFNIFFVKEPRCVINLHSRSTREVWANVPRADRDFAVINNNPGINKGRAMRIIKFTEIEKPCFVGIYPHHISSIFLS